MKVRGRAVQRGSAMPRDSIALKGLGSGGEADLVESKNRSGVTGQRTTSLRSA